MKNNDTSLNMILMAGIVFVLVGFLFMVAFAGKSAENIAYNIYPILLCVLGLVFLAIHIIISKSTFQLFIGLDLVLNGLFCFAVTHEIFKIGMKKLWPILIILTGLSLIVASKTKQKKFSMSYDFSGIVLICMGAFYLMFSLGVIKLPFSQIAIISAPFILILLGVFLIILFCKRKALLKILPDEVSSEFLEQKEEEYQELDF